MKRKSLFTKEEKKRLKELKMQNIIVRCIGNKILEDFKKDNTGD